MIKRMQAFSTFLVLVSMMVVSALATATYKDARHEAAISTLQATYAKQQARAAADTIARLQAAQSKADALTRQLQSKASANAATTQKANHEITRHTVGRICLSSGAVSVLNSAISADASPHLPASTTGALRAGAATPADTNIATDTNVASWAVTARSMYATCRDRLDALIDYHLSN